MDEDSLFIPSSHVEKRTRRAHLWKSSEASGAESWEALLDAWIDEMEDCVGFAISCRLHVVVYATNLEARTHLQRDVPPTMLLVPVSGPRDSVVAVQSAAADAANGDLKRMHRHLSHEIAHVMVALRTGSEKRLGDGDRLMRVAPWVNEGFATCAAAICAGQLDALERVLARASGVSFDVDSALNDLTSEHRAAAMAVATAGVWQAIRTRGLRQVFDSLTELERA